MPFLFKKNAPDESSASGDRIALLRPPLCFGPLGLDLNKASHSRP